MPNFTYINDREVTLEECQQYVGGYIEIVFLKNGDQMIVNEEGLLLHFPINQQATRLHQLNFGLTEFPIVGNVMVLSGIARLD